MIFGVIGHIIEYTETNRQKVEEGEGVRTRDLDGVPGRKEL